MVYTRFGIYSTFYVAIDRFALWIVFLIDRNFKNIVIYIIELRIRFNTTPKRAVAKVIDRIHRFDTKIRYIYVHTYNVYITGCVYSIYIYRECLAI